MVRLGPALAEWQEKNMEHLRYEYDLSPNEIVLDIGSYRREFADEIYRKYGCYVECFDALDNKAAWTEDGNIQMGGQFYYTSFFDSASPQRVYKCVDIAPYLKAPIGLIKINIEGMEYELLKYIIGKGLHTNIRYLQVQFHLIDGVDCESEYAEIALELSKTHDLMWRVPFVWESWKCMRVANAG